MTALISSQGVWFPHWADVLAKVRLKDLERQAYRRAIVEYLSFCKRSRQRATVVSARLFMTEVEAGRRLSRSQLAVWKAALNCFSKWPNLRHRRPPLPVGQASAPKQLLTEAPAIRRPCLVRAARNRPWRRRIRAGRSGNGV